MSFQTKEEAADWATAIAASVQQMRGLMYAQKHGRAVEPRLAMMEKLLSAGSSKRGEVRNKRRSKREIYMTNIDRRERFCSDHLP
jgi:hypothetical protein